LQPSGYMVTTTPHLGNALRLQALRHLLPAHDARRELRVACGMTLQDIANEVGVDKATVMRWERGKRDPSRHHIEAYVTVLVRLASELEMRHGIDGGPV
jgi:DNA-binding transcriptional regulator YiaG